MTSLAVTSLADSARAVERFLTRRKVKLTLGGEPTYVPVDPEGEEWHITATGPTKLGYAYTLADRLARQDLPKSLCLFTPGKQYPGEINPRWALHLVWNADGTPIAPPPTGAPQKLTRARFGELLGRVARSLGLEAGSWLPGRDPVTANRGHHVAVLPLDHDDDAGWRTGEWKVGARGRSLPLLDAEGPAGLRLPLHLLGPDALRRALVVEWRKEAVHVFLPPFLQDPFVALLGIVTGHLHDLGVLDYRLQGYLPPDEGRRWHKLGLASDPGVLEVNIPPCPKWHDYARWLELLAAAAGDVGLVPSKTLPSGLTECTGGGNHLLFGGPTLEENPLFRRPAFVAALCRYFQHHPCLAYIFTGKYVGRASQAPRPDESTTTLADLELAYSTLESLPRGDHRLLICETLRNLHTDDSGSSHRSEISFDKFWIPGGPEGSCAGLIEFRSISSMPDPVWSAAVALLFRAIAARLLKAPVHDRLHDFGPHLQDRYLLPAFLHQDLRAVLTDLKQMGFPLPDEPFESIWDWRFPLVLEGAGGSFHVRRGLESWPLVGDIPTAGGNTSRFVDTSMERLEFNATRDFASSHTLYVNGRPLDLLPFPGSRRGVGLRYRRSALYPCLHPSVPTNLPLVVTAVHHATSKRTSWSLDDSGSHGFEPTDQNPLPDSAFSPCRPQFPKAVTADLRIP
ncbi:hypothetical protein BH23VER1_BH23VER1_05350 [soil metagenome]